MAKSTTMMSEIGQIKIKHPRAADFMAKISRQEDCFGMMLDDKSDDCARCVMRAEYKGTEYAMKDLCKIFMQMPVVDDPKGSTEDCAPEDNTVSSSEEGVVEGTDNQEIQTEGEDMKKSKKAVKVKAAKKDKPAKAPKAEKAQKPAGAKKSGSKDQILDLLKKHEMSQPELVEKVGIRGSTMNIALNKMMAAGTIKRRQEGRGFIYFMA